MDWIRSRKSTGSSWAFCHRVVQVCPLLLAACQPLAEPWRSAVPFAQFALIRSALVAIARGRYGASNAIQAGRIARGRRGDAVAVEAGSLGLG